MHRALVAAFSVIQAGCGSSETEQMSLFIVNGEELPAQAEIRLRDETPLYNLGARTELNVAGWYAQSLAVADDREVVTLRLYNETDFRSELLMGGTISGAVMDSRDHSAGEPNSYALKNEIVDNHAVSLKSTRGTFEVDFSATGYVSGSFTAHLTNSDGRVPPSEVEVEFDLPVYVDCFQNLNSDGDERRLDPDFSSEFCAPFKGWKWDEE